MKKAKSLTEEQKLEAVRIAIEGKDPRVYLEECGQLDPVSAWIRVKAWCKTAQPHLYEDLPKRLPTGGTWHKALPKVEASVKVDGPIRIETPEANRVQVVETPEKPKIDQPLMHSGKKAIGWEGDFGNYIYDRKHQYIDYESNDGEEISMPVESWREWMKEIREIAQLMGVEL